MNVSLKITLLTSPGAILRVLGLAERRGYDPIRINTELNNGIITILMTIKAERPIEILVAQYTKLFGIQTVEVYHDSKIRVA